MYVCKWQIADLKLIFKNPFSKFQFWSVDEKFLQISDFNFYFFSAILKMDFEKSTSNPDFADCKPIETVNL